MILQILFRILFLLFVLYFVFGFIIIIVKENHTYLVERLGRFHKELNSGIHFLIPLMDVIVFKSSKTEDNYSSKKLAEITKDKKEIKFTYQFKFKILDPKKYFYSSNRNQNSIPALIEMSLKNEISELKFNDVQLFKFTINQSVLKQFTDKTEEGYEVLSFQINLL